MHQLNCLILEDEPLAAELLTEYLAQINYLHLVAVCENAFIAADYLQNESIDVIFLDLHLPKIKGFDFLKTLPDPPQIIVTSAYHQYALEGFELNVVDYLLKPIELVRFMKAINKLKPRSAEATGLSQEITLPDHIFVPTNRTMTRINFHDILYVESLRQYIRIVTTDQTVVTKLNIGNFEPGLPAQLIRIHKSFIISKDHIKSYNHKFVTLSNDKVIPIGATYKNEFLNHFPH